MNRFARHFTSLLAFLSLFPATAFTQEKAIDHLLKLNLEELMDVQVVTATKKSQKISEVPATVRVISAKQIEQRGYFTLDDVLSDLPGFQFRDIIGFNSYTFLRGVPGQNQTILLMVDGIQVNELNSGGFYGGGQFNLANVKAIEVVYGPASSLYGTNALSGIINIITYQPGDSPGGCASVTAGNFDTWSADFRYELYQKKNEVGFDISGMLKHSDKADLRGAKGDNNWSDDMENFEDDLEIDGKFAYKGLTAGFLYQDKQASRTTNYKSIGTRYLDRGTEWHIQFVNSYLKYQYLASSGLSFESQFYYRNATVKDNTVAYVLSDQGQTGYYRPNHLVGFENQIEIPLFDRISWISGIVLEREDLAEAFSETQSSSPDIAPPKPPAPPMIDNSLTSLYTQLQYEIVRECHLTLGVRHDNSSYYGNVNTPRFGLVYNRGRLTAKLLYMEAFRAPKPWEYTFGVGNPDLDPEKMRSWELATTCRIAENLTANLSYYNNSVNKNLTSALDRVVNGDKLNTDGFEISIEYSKGKIASYFNYTYTNSEWDSGIETDEIAKHGFNLGMTYSLSGRHTLNLRGNYLGRRKNPSLIPATGGYYIDDAFILNATYSLLDFNHFDIHLTVNNLLDSKYYHTSNRPPARYRQPERTVRLRLVYNF